MTYYARSYRSLVPATFRYAKRGLKDSLTNMNVNETCHAPITSSPSQDSNPSLVESTPPNAIGNRAALDPALTRLRAIERGDGVVSDKLTARRTDSFQSKPAGVGTSANQIRSYQHPEHPLPGGLPDELWEMILEATGIPHEVDPLDIEHFTPESLRLLLDLRLTSQRFNQLTRPAHEALLLADGFVKGLATPFAQSRLDDFAQLDVFRLNIPTVAHLQQGLRWLTAEPSEDVTQAEVVTTNRQKLKAAVPKATEQFKKLLSGRTATANKSGPSAAVQPTAVVLRRSDLRRDGAYRQRLEALKSAKIEQLWPTLENAWPDSMGRGHTPKEWTRPLTVLCRLDLSPERKRPVLIQKVWPKLANLPVACHSEPLAALLMQRDLPDEIRDGATRLLKEGHETNCATRAHAQALGALAIQLHQAPLGQRLDALNEMLAPGGALFDLPREHLALALVPLANLDIRDASPAQQQYRFDQVQALRQRLPESSEMHRLLPRRPDDPHHMLVRMRRVQWGKFDPEHPEDGMGWEGTPFTLRDFLSQFGGAVRAADEPMSLNDFRQMISIARVGYQAQAPGSFQSFLEYQASALGCLRPKAILQGVRAVLDEMHGTYATDAASVLRDLIGWVSMKGEVSSGETIPLLRIPGNDLPALFGLLQREIDSPLTYNPRTLISRIEAALSHRSDIEAIRPQAKQWLESLVARHPHLIVDEFSAHPKLQLAPLSKFWQRPVK